MKRSFISVLMTLAFFWACETLDEPVGDNALNPSDRFTLIAVADGELVPQWKKGDVIKVVCDGKKYLFTADSTGRKVPFTGEGDLTAEMIGDNPVEAYFNCSTPRGAFRVSAEQEFKDSLSSASIPMYAYTMNRPQNNTLTLNFKPLASVIRLTLPSYAMSLDKILIRPAEEATIGEGAMAGTYIADAGQAGIKVNNAVNQLELTFDTPLDMTDGAQLTIPIGWFSISGGLEFVLVYDQTKEIPFVYGTEGTLKTFDDSDGFKKGLLLSADFVLDLNSFPRPYYVTPDAPSGGNGVDWATPATLSYALKNAREGSVIHMASGIYRPDESLSYEGAEDSSQEDTYGFEVVRNISMIGGYPENPSAGDLPDLSAGKTVLDGGSSSMHVLVVAAPKVAGEKVTVSNVTITNGKNAETSKSFLSYGENRLHSVKGAGLAIVGTEVELNDVVVCGNNGFQAAGVFAIDSDISMKGCSISGNKSENNGGGAWFDNGVELYMDGCTIEGNHSATIAGGLYLHVDKAKTLQADIRNTIVTGNSADSNQGGMYIYDASGNHGIEASFTGCTFSENRANMSACCHLLHAKADFSDCFFVNNVSVPESAPGNGIINIYNSSIARFDGCVFDGNVGRGTIQHVTPADYGTEGPVMVIANCLFSNNTSDQRGACMWLRGKNGSAYIVNSTFTGNSAGSLGSVIAANEDIDIDVISCTLSGNRTNNKTHYGAITSEGDATVINLFNTILSGNITTKDSSGNPVEAVAEIKINKGSFNPKYSFVGSSYYDESGTVAADISFDYKTMFLPLAGNVMPLTGGSNPALTMGMPLNGLKERANEYISAEMLSKDQAGNERTGNVAGAYVLTTK
ncbi:MAG: right-handed parallel beta-helix repeat-containing protein [Bacteroidales bacterium]|nr:right-handed parallel beta-helix repeat-containing protein [Bacteroidales bacterium]